MMESLNWAKPAYAGLMENNLLALSATLLGTLVQMKAIHHIWSTMKSTVTMAILFGCCCDVSLCVSACAYIGDRVCQGLVG